MNEVVLRESAVLAKPLKIYTISYRSNNSGGGWWIDDEGWKALDKTEWEVKWAKAGEDFVNSDGRYMGALAVEASVKVETTSMHEAFRLAVTAWREATGQNPGAEGCNCCGPPHSFEGKTGEHGDPDFEESWMDASHFYEVTYRDPW